MRVSLMRWCETGGQGPIEPIVNEAFDLLASGLDTTRESIRL